MLYYKNKNNEIFAYEKEDQYNDLIPKDLSPITEEEMLEIMKLLPSKLKELEKLKDNFENRKIELLNNFNDLKNQAELKFDNKLIEELKEDFSEELSELEENYIKDLEEVKNGN